MICQKQKAWNFLHISDLFKPQVQKLERCQIQDLSIVEQAVVLNQFSNWNQIWMCENFRAIFINVSSTVALVRLAEGADRSLSFKCVFKQIERVQSFEYKF